jgi:hypothetical protein
MTDFASGSLRSREFTNKGIADEQSLDRREAGHRPAGAEPEDLSGINDILASFWTAVRRLCMAMVNSAAHASSADDVARPADQTF